MVFAGLLDGKAFLWARPLVLLRQNTWGHDGKELFYVAPDGKMMAVAVKTGATFAASTPKALFELSSVRGIADNSSVQSDGQGFLLRTNVGAATPQPFTVVLNWTKLLNAAR